MQPTTEILERISKDSLTHKEEVFTRLYRYLLRPDIYYQAYQRLYTNKGASTKGINQDTADGFSEAKIEKIIQSLADETYQPTPVRRTYIAKKSNPKKKRPLRNSAHCWYRRCCASAWLLLLSPMRAIPPRWKNLSCRKS